jgi:cell division septation protein DedD
MPDDSLRDSPLQGKQLVFLFMSVTVLAVVIFLCGVMVGRGARDARPALALAETVDPTATATAPTSPDATDAAATAKPATATEQELQYPTDLTRLDPPADLPLEPVPAADAPVPAVERRATASRDRPARSGVERPAEPAGESEFREPSGNGFVVQVHAARQRAEATAMAKRLATKGYSAFVTTSGNGAARMYRVRVGKFAQRREAEAVSRRLEAEEQFKPWITR